MKSLLILLLLSGGLATSAAAQAGWGTSDSWDAPKKKTVKKTPVPARQSQAVSQDKAMRNNGAAVEAPAPVAAPALASSGFGASGGASSAPTGMSMGMSAAPGTPVMMQSGRNVLRDDAIAARERRRLHWAGKPAAAVVVPVPVEVAPAPVAAAVTTGAGNAAGGQQTAPPATKPVRSTKSPKKAVPAPSGW